MKDTDLVKCSDCGEDHLIGFSCWMKLANDRNKRFDAQYDEMDARAKERRRKIREQGIICPTCNEKYDVTTDYGIIDCSCGRKYAVSDESWLRDKPLF